MDVKRLTLIVLLLTSAALASAQTYPVALPAHVIVDACSGCGGGGTVAIDQTTPGTTNGVVVNNVPHIVCDSGCGSPPATADNSAFAFGTTSVSPIGAVVDDVGTNAVAENSFGAPRMTGNRVLYADLSQTGANATAIKVDGSAATQPVSGTVAVSNFPATQPVSGTVTVTDGAGALNVIVDSGSITANAGTNLNTSALALSATQTDRTQKTQLTDGTRDGTVKAASTAAAAADTSLVVALSPNSALPTGSNTIGALTANQSVNLAQVAGTNTVNGGLAGSQSIGGTAGSNAAITQNPVLGALEARSSVPTAATNGQQHYQTGDLAGNTYNVYPYSFTCTADNIAATLTQLTGCGVPSAGYSLYVTSVIVQSTTTTAGTWQLRSGTGSNCATTTTAVLPAVSTSRTYPAPANTATPFMYSSSSGVKLTAGHALCVIGVATNTTNITVTGFIAP